MNKKVESLNGLSEKEIEEKIQKEIEENNLSEMEKLRRDNPALNDAWEQIKIIRNLMQLQQQKESKPAWERAYREVLEGIETKNEALKEAWNKYYTLKKLLMGNKHAADSS